MALSKKTKYKYYRQAHAKLVLLTSEIIGIINTHNALINEYNELMRTTN